MRTGVAAFTFCVTLSRSAVSLPGAESSEALSSQRRTVAFTGTVVSQPTSRASPGPSVMRLACSAWPSRLALTSTSITRSEALRTVKRESKRSPSRTSGASPECSIKSCVARIDISPVPNNPAPESATAMMRNDVSESLSGISTTALPFASSGTRAFHISSESKISLAFWSPPPPPCANALRP